VISDDSSNSSIVLGLHSGKNQSSRLYCS